MTFTKHLWFLFVPKQWSGTARVAQLIFKYITGTKQSFYKFCFCFVLMLQEQCKQILFRSHTPLGATIHNFCYFRIFAECHCGLAETVWYIIWYNLNSYLKSLSTWWLMNDLNMKKKAKAHSHNKNITSCHQQVH